MMIARLDDASANRLTTVHHGMGSIQEVVLSRRPILSIEMKKKKKKKIERRRATR
jgi:hypothetical protein